MASKRRTRSTKFSITLSPIYEAPEGSSRPSSRDLITTLREQLTYQTTSKASTSRPGQRQSLKSEKLWPEDVVVKSSGGHLQDPNPIPSISFSSTSPSPTTVTHRRVEEGESGISHTESTTVRGPHQQRHREQVYCGKKVGRVGKCHTSLAVRQVTVQRAEGEDLGISFVPSWGVTRSFYKEFTHMYSPTIW
ncbi:hypothetical protein ACOMHN_060876 [Nucella lapillus]